MVVWLIRRAGRKLPYVRLAWLFRIFILSCGAAHLFEVLTLWIPLSWLPTAAKLLTAIASASTCAFLIWFAKDILNLLMDRADAGTLRGNARFRSLVETALMAVIAADRNGNVTSSNPSAEGIFGWK